MTGDFSVDALVPKETAAKAALIARAKACLDAPRLLALAVLAGAFISLGAVFSTTVAAGTGDLPFGVARLLMGITFSLGLILVVLAGAELFTGNNLIVMAWAGRQVSTGALLRNWALAYTGNFAGAMATAGLVFLSGHYAFGGGSIGAAALGAAVHKCSLGFGQALVLGILCNALVCLAVWLAIGARSAAGKILAVMFPVAAFVAAGFEHCVASMYYMPLALFIKTDAAYLEMIGKTAADYGAVTWEAFLLGNLLPVTIGNILGGAGMVGLVYWFVYLRGSDSGSR